MLINSTTQGSIYFVGPELDPPISLGWKPLKIGKYCQKLQLVLLRELPRIVSPAPLHSIAGSNIFLSPRARQGNENK